MRLSCVNELQSIDSIGESNYDAQYKSEKHVEVCFAVDALYHHESRCKQGEGFRIWAFENHLVNQVAPRDSARYHFCHRRQDASGHFLAVGAASKLLACATRSHWERFPQRALLLTEDSKSALFIHFIYDALPPHLARYS